MTELHAWLTWLDGAQITPRVPWAVLEWLRFDRHACADASTANDRASWVAVRAERRNRDTRPTSHVTPLR